ncbi:MAG: PIN domain nuclease [Thiogranum sp.]
MILVGTSVWIDFFAGRDLPHVTALEHFILDNEDLALCGIILAEILQGIADDTTHRRVRRYVSPLIMLPMSEAVFVRAADIYRKLRIQGITIRKTNDCTIAATALDHHCQLLHNDKDFVHIAKQVPLKMVKPFLSE